MTAQPKAELRSAALYERAKQVLPGGVSRNTVLRSPHPIYVSHAKGCRVVDVEGVTRIDLANNMASLIHGHAHPVVTQAVIAQLQRGSAFSLGTEVEVTYAEHLSSRNKGFEKLRFVNSGTEAVMAALKAARAYTGRAKIAKVEGAYHGGYDYAEVSQTSTPANWGRDDNPASVPVAYGTPSKALEDVVVIPFNNPERAKAILDRHGTELACVLVDLMPHRVGLNRANPDFIEMLRDWTLDNEALLVFDEVITFRSQYGGAQEWYDVEPDITALGKIIGGGFPVGALAGSSEIMEVMNPLASNVRFPHSGTFSANPVTMSAGLAAMRLFDRDAVHRVNELSTRARFGIEEVISKLGAKACVTGDGSMLRMHMKSELPANYRQAFNSLAEKRRLAFMLDHLFDSGFIMINTGAFTVSTAMTENEIDGFIEAVEIGFRRLAAV